MSRSHPTSSHQPSPETPRRAGAASDYVDPVPSEEEAVACSRALARQHRVVPLRQEGDTLVIGAARPVSPAVRNEIAFATGHAIAVERVADERVAAYCGPDDHPPEATSPDGSSDPSPEPEVSETGTSEAAALETATPEPGTPAPANGGDMPPDDRQQQDHPTERKQTADKQAKAPPAEQGAPRQAAASRRLQDLRVEGSAPQQVYQIIQGAIACGASDIHIEPYAETYRVRYRLDGVLHEVAELALRRQPELTARRTRRSGPA
ncbi:hypothetical protein [Longimonas halophila]|nr:hypothetical protein [Longimonas halophila]